MPIAKIFRILLCAFFISFPFFSLLAGDTPEPKIDLREDIKGQLFAIGSFSGLGSNEGRLHSVEGIIGEIISAVLLLVGTVFFALIVYGGYLWMTAHGNTEQAKEARDTIIQASIGIFIVMGAWLITEYILFAALKATKLV